MEKDTANSNINPVRILVVGTGAVGGFYGSRLARAGAEVTTVNRSDYKEVANNGIFIKSIDGDYHFKPHAVLKNVADYQGYPDYILIALKSLPQLDIGKIIAPAVGPKTKIFLLQNGINIEENISVKFLDNEIISGLAFICVNRIKPGHISHLCYGKLVVGAYPDGNSAAVDKLANLFNESKTPCRISESIITERWRKLIWNAPFNPISVLTQTDTQQIMAKPETVTLVRTIMEEVYAVAASVGHILPTDVIDKNIADTEIMRPYKTSMLLDFEENRPMEVEAILGNIVRTAKKSGIMVPHLQTMYELLTLLVRGGGQNQK
ncbi:MAG: 2-dehydropantoate 2-reductase [Magnetococcales bacterium]|nr:2-dehydropantoate 2-reductase [Magnetococcales bacterium]